MRRVRLCALLLALMLGLGAVVPVGAQENKGGETTSPKLVAAYRLEFVFSELQGGKRVNSRSYEMLAQQGRVNKLRAGARVPVSTGSPNFQYLDIGMSIDCQVEERDGHIALSLTADSSNFKLPEAEKITSAPHQPIIQQLRSQVDTLVSPGKPTVISSMDDPSSKRRFQLEVTATKVE